VAGEGRGRGKGRGREKGTELPESGEVDSVGDNIKRRREDDPVVEVTHDVQDNPAEAQVDVALMVRPFSEAVLKYKGDWETNEKASNLKVAKEYVDLPELSRCLLVVPHDFTAGNLRSYLSQKLLEGVARGECTVSDEVQKTLSNVKSIEIRMTTERMCYALIDKTMMGSLRRNYCKNEDLYFTLYYSISKTVIAKTCKPPKGEEIVID